MSGPNWKPIKGAYVLERKRKQEVIRERRTLAIATTAAIAVALEGAARRDECEWLTAAVVERVLGTWRRQTVH